MQLNATDNILSGNKFILRARESFEALRNEDEETRIGHYQRIEFAFLGSLDS